MLGPHEAAVPSGLECPSPCLAFGFGTVAVAAVNVQAVMLRPDALDGYSLDDVPVAAWSMVLAFGEDRRVH